MKIKKVALIGLGAIGSFFAPKLNKYLGQNFKVIAGGSRKERLVNNGITVNGVTYHFTVVDPDCNNAGPSDLVIIAVKEMGLDAAISDIKNQIGPNTVIMCVMNGLDSEERIAAVYGWDRVLYSYIRVSIAMKDGVTEYDPAKGLVHFGEAKNDMLSERVKAVGELFDVCGINSHVDRDMIRGMWFKFMGNIGENLTCALLGIPFGVYRVSEDATAILIGAMREVVEIAGRLSIGLCEKDIDDQVKSVKALPFNNRPSTLQDLDNGRITEIGMFAGKVLELGEKTGVKTPINWMFYHGIRVLEEKNLGKFKEQLCNK